MNVNVPVTLLVPLVVNCKSLVVVVILLAEAVKWLNILLTPALISAPPTIPIIPFEVGAFSLESLFTLSLIHFSASYPTKLVIFCDKLDKGLELP